jgi:hypothetical protein
MSPLRKACISKDVSNLRKHINWVLKHVLVSCQLWGCLVDDQARHANTGARQNIGERIARPGFARAWA